MFFMKNLLPCICLLYWFPGQCDCTFVRRRNVKEILWKQNWAVYLTLNPCQLYSKFLGIYRGSRIALTFQQFQNQNLLSPMAQ